ADLDYLGDVFCVPRKHDDIGAVLLDRESIALIDHQIGLSREHILDANGLPQAVDKWTKRESSHADNDQKKRGQAPKELYFMADNRRSTHYPSCWASFSTTSLPIFSDEVAAGEGAFRTLMIRPRG